MDEYYRVVRALGPPFGELLGTLPPARAAEIQEIRLRAGQPLQFTVAGRLVPCAQLLPVLRASGPLRQEDIRQTFLALCGHSVYAYEQELQDGYFTLPGGHRVGVAGLRGPGGFAAVTALCLRVARFITCPLPQALRQALDRLDGGILVIGPPGSGKTTRCAASFTIWRRRRGSSVLRTSAASCWAKRARRRTSLASTAMSSRGARGRPPCSWPCAA